MKVFVLGATGAIGRLVVEEAIRAGLNVTALARNADAFPLKGPGLKVVQGNAFNVESFQAALGGHDAVISCLGPRNIRKPAGLFSTALPPIVQAASVAGVPRVVVLTADFDASYRTPGHPAPWIYRRFVAPVILNKLYDDIRLFEDWAAGTFGMDLGRSVQASPSGERLATSMTIVRPYQFKSWTTTEFRTHITSADSPGLPHCSYKTSRRALALFLASQAWREPSFNNKAVLIDTPNPVGCMG